MKKSKVVLLLVTLMFSSLLLSGCGKKRDKKSSEAELNSGSSFEKDVSSRDKNSVMDEDFDYYDDDLDVSGAKSKEKIKGGKSPYKTMDDGDTKKSGLGLGKGSSSGKYSSKSQPKVAAPGSNANVKVSSSPSGTNASKGQSTTSGNISFDEYKKWLESKKSGASADAGKQQSTSSVVASSAEPVSSSNSVVSQISSVVSQTPQTTEKVQSSAVKKEDSINSVASSTAVVASSSISN